MSEFRRCSRPGCGRPAVATLTYAYAESTAVVGPLAPTAEPHSWDLCARHADNLTAPLGWEMLHVKDIEIDEDEDITALAEAVREAGQVTSGLVAPQDPSDTDDSALDPVTSNHPVHRSRRVAEEKTRRRAHLHVVPDPDDDADDDERH
ncbi:hypothetical protein CFRA_02965 [Corynebacterium frankenforstense DSM 45800]|uniref:DUF3499 domain-containing protein n=1 Tax=Corynebacterium frankenforstense DSM 45800 TaxID=1437875 RepID=A0A1L7CRE6_9CORY|nr:DUF3499 domain-containing protein [Corynebacterium frankenforstense]APT88407.1 hypothetical protein CFRA_02965 [Corynebacterium frankenforstense DSM 45800]